MPLTEAQLVLLSAASQRDDRLLPRPAKLAGAVLGRMEAAAPRDRVIRSAVTVLAGAALCGVGLLLERACRVPREDDDDKTEPDTPD